MGAQLGACLGSGRISEFDATVQRRAQVSERRQRIGEQVLIGLIIAGVTGIATGYLVSQRAVEEMGTQMAVVQSQLARLQTDVTDMRRDLYQPRIGADSMNEAPRHGSR